jgi:hypothetical protein
MEATSQRAVREVGMALISADVTPNSLFRTLSEVIDKIGITRSNALANALIVKAFTDGTLDTFEAAGKKRVGVTPERIKKPDGVKAKAADADPAMPEGLRMLFDAGRDRRRRKVRNLVEVLTAGDDDVCQTCQDLADDGPYLISVARRLIPAHPNCRCAFVPWDDDRFADPEEED